MSDSHRVTARDVAALASVSPATVSKALSGKGAVHPDTRDRVLEAARQLAFQVTRRGRGEVARGDLTVGVVTREPFNRRTGPMLLGVLERLTEHGIAMLVRDGGGDLAREREAVEALTRRSVDGFLISGGDAGCLVRPSFREQLVAPSVYALTASVDPRDVSVVADDRGGARVAAQHLLTRGRRRLICILGPQEEEVATIKVDAVREVLHSRGAELATAPLCGGWTDEWGYTAVSRVLAEETAFDGVVCGNDAIAAGVANALQRAGLRIPADVGVVGCDNRRGPVDALTPSLTSVDLMLPDVGREAANRLIAAMAGHGGEPGIAVIPSQLVPRDSTAVKGSEKEM